MMEYYMTKSFPALFSAFSFRFNHLFILFTALLIVFPACGSDSNSSSKRLKAGEIVKITLLQTTDIHNRVSGSEPSDSYKTANDRTKGGFARLAGKITSIRKIKKTEGIPVLLFDTGDSLSGTIYDMLTEDNKNSMALVFFNLMKYDAITLGSNDFLYGLNFLPELITTACGKNYNGFTIPIIESNLKTDNSDETDDDKLEELIEKRIITDSILSTLDNGLVVGILGIMGTNAYSGISAKIYPSHFVTDYSIIQSKIDQLRSYNPDIVIVLAHAETKGVCACYNCDNCIEGNDDYDECMNLCEPECDCISNPSGDGVSLAGALSGVDVFLSGSGHELTGFMLLNSDDLAASTVNVNAASQTITANESGNPEQSLQPVLISAGKHGEYLSQLDLTIKIGTGIKKTTLTNHEINSFVESASSVDFMTELINIEINKLLSSKNMPEINDTAGASEAGTSLERPADAKENNLGNLVADSFRYAFKTLIDEAESEGNIIPPTIGVVGNGIIQNGFLPDSVINFADLFTVLPLGNSLDLTQTGRPGYPLIKAYLSGEHILNLCQFAAYTIAAQDSEFRSELSARTSFFYKISADLSATNKDFTYWENELSIMQETGDSGSGSYSDDYYTRSYAKKAYEALTNSCDCDDENDPGYNIENPEDCECSDIDPGWTEAAGIYKDGASFLTILSSLISELTPENYINISGVNYLHKNAASLYKVFIDNVKLYQNSDYKCATLSTKLKSVEPDILYPFATDLFTILFITDPKIRNYMQAIDIAINPVSSDGGITAFSGTVMNSQFRFDISPEASYPATIHQELKCWQALYQYINTGLAGTILKKDYGIVQGRVGKIE